MNSGVYQIRNILNGKIYIGGSDNISERRVNHFSELRNNKHHSVHLQNAWNKYNKPEDIFIFEILEFCESNWTIIEELENHYLDLLGKSKDYINKINSDFLKLTYNIKPVSQRGFFGKHRIESILKGIVSNSKNKRILCYKNNNFLGEFIGNIDCSYSTGVKRSVIYNACKSKRFITKSGYLFCYKDDKVELESKMNNLIIQPINKGISLSREERNKINFNRRPVRVIELNSGIKNEFLSQKEACECFKIQPCVMCNLLKSGKIHKRRNLKFEYI